MGCNFWVCDIPEHVAQKIRARAEAKHHPLQEELRAILIEATREALPEKPERGIDDALRRWRGAFPKAAAGATVAATLDLRAPVPAVGGDDEKGRGN